MQTTNVRVLMTGRCCAFEVPSSACLAYSALELRRVWTSPKLRGKTRLVVLACESLREIPFSHFGPRLLSSDCGTLWNRRFVLHILHAVVIVIRAPEYRSIRWVVTVNVYVYDSAHNATRHDTCRPIVSRWSSLIAMRQFCYAVTCTNGDRLEGRRDLFD